MKTRRGEGVLFVASWLALAVPSVQPANAQMLGSEFQVNSYTTNTQWAPKVAADGLGQFVVVWESETQDAGGYGVFGQRFAPSGAPVGAEFQINSYTTGAQLFPAVAADGAGNFVVAWQSNQDGSSYGVIAQIFTPAGVPFGSPFQVNTYTTGSQNGPVLASDGPGNVVVLWTSEGQDGSSDGVFGRFAPAGFPFGPQFQVNSYTTGNQNKPAVAIGNSGTFVVVWGSQGQDGSNYGVFGQRFDSLGAAVGGEFQVSSYTTGGQHHPGVVMDGAGNFAVVWNSNLQDGSSWGVFGQRFDAVGTATGSEFQVNSYTTSVQYQPTVAADSAGNFLVVWDSNGPDGSVNGVFGQRFDATATRVGGEFQINTYTTSEQFGGAVVGDGLGNLDVVWMSSGQDGSAQGVFGQRLGAVVFAESASNFEVGDACGWSFSVGAGCP